MQYMLLIYGRRRLGGRSARRSGSSRCGAYMELAERPRDSRRRRPRRTLDRHDRPRPRRRDADDRRAVRRDEGAARRLYLVECDELDEAHRDRRARSRPRARRRRSRSGRWSSAERARAGLPRGVGARARDPDRRPRRLRPRRGRGPGRVRDRRSSAGPRDGVPDNPGAWLMTTARNRAIDRIRRERTLAAQDASCSRRRRRGRRGRWRPTAIPDERLRLIFTCCHPALALEAQVALTLRTLGGLDDRARSRARSSSRSRRWRSGSCARSGRSATRASRSACRPTTCCPSGCAPCSRSLYLVFNEGYGPPPRARALRRGDPARRRCSPC